MMLVRNKQFGRYSRQVIGVIERSKRLSPLEEERLESAWQDIIPAQWNDVWNDVWFAIDSSPEIAWRWWSAWYATMPYTKPDTTASYWWADWCSDGVEMWEAVANDRRGAVRAAVLALVVRDLVEPDVFAVLYEPWKRVMEAPVSG